jgi:predicted aspartyl protease
MLIAGEWYPCDDGIERPVLRCEVLGDNGVWVKALFLVDTGADRTVLSADVFSTLAIQPSATGERLAGVGGLVDSVSIETKIRLTTDVGRKVSLRGQYAAIANPEALDMSVLGRDISGLFAVVVDRPGNAVSLLGQRHTYRIEHD